THPFIYPTKKVGLIYQAPTQYESNSSNYLYY
ncbi:unnamed protein product, partial [marine sediment metagenome]